jgi:opine dehydrogenase
VEILATSIKPSIARIPTAVNCGNSVRRKQSVIIEKILHHIELQKAMTTHSDLVVAIVGAGIGGTELAGYLGLNRRRVRLHDVRPEAVSGIRDRGGLEVSGIASGFAPIERATTDLAEALDGATLIAVTTLNNDHQVVAAALAPLLQSGQTICLMPGYVGGALQLRHSLDELGCRAEVKLGEMDNFPFTGAILGQAAVRLASLKRHLQVSALPASDGLAVAELVRRVLPPTVPAANVFQTGLATMNPVLHVPAMLGNQGRLDAGERFQFYGAGITPSVARVIDAVDAERMAVALAFEVDVPTLRGWLAQTYGLEGGDLYALIQRLHAEIFKDSPAPGALATRYVTEDVPYGLVPLAELGRLGGVPMPVAEALITVASVALARDFRHEGRTLARMGLQGRSFQAARSAIS